MQVTRTANPAKIVYCDLAKEQFFFVHNRTGALLGEFGIDLVREVCEEVTLIDKSVQNMNPRFGPRHYVKLRELAIDDKNGSFTLYVDYLHDREVEPELTVEQIQSALHDGKVRHHGQGQWIKVSVLSALFGSDSFSPINSSFYATAVV